MIVRMTTHLTIRGLDAEIEAELKALARSRNLSINKAALALIRKGAGIAEPGLEPERIGNALDRFVGTWSASDEKEVLDAVAGLDNLDEGLWR